MYCIFYFFCAIQKILLTQIATTASIGVMDAAGMHVLNTFLSPLSSHVPSHWSFYSSFKIIQRMTFYPNSVTLLFRLRARWQNARWPECRGIPDWKCSECRSFWTCPVVGYVFATFVTRSFCYISTLVWMHNIFYHVLTELSLWGYGCLWGYGYCRNDT